MTASRKRSGYIRSQAQPGTCLCSAGSKLQRRVTETISLAEAASTIHVPHQPPLLLGGWVKAVWEHIAVKTGFETFTHAKSILSKPVSSQIFRFAIHLWPESKACCTKYFVKEERSWNFVPAWKPSLTRQFRADPGAPEGHPVLSGCSQIGSFSLKLPAMSSFLRCWTTPSSKTGPPLHQQPSCSSKYNARQAPVLIQ